MSFRIILVDPTGDVVLDGRSVLHENAAPAVMQAPAPIEESASDSEPPTLRSAESGFFPTKILDGAAKSKTSAA
ncbi:hypothetical protein AKJ09_05568 [Labilithrix luteola]|uniref:Uncharacterized protein n=1 Tax=Labilithrix luteola TaxID=1391654 RepID=A0A0K1Q0G2_9BACT|nr:hypothetical protein [Labilithrix luteola]AKU98904.1 hypothetical protein AKJ09_05568 [Labilithrix luteola]